VFVSGLVQGVFFRSEVRRLAHRNDVRGWVRNLPDGRVEAIFEGDQKNVNELVQFCRKGPPGAQVSKTKVRMEAFTGEFRDFQITW
jgi:acylphosphatase